MIDHSAARAEMVESQLVPRGIRDARVLDAMRSVPRHRFIPEDNRDLAYRDGPVAIGQGQTISQQSHLFRLTNTMLRVRIFQLPILTLTIKRQSP